MEIWQFKIRLPRKKVKWWAININAGIKKQKKDLLKEYEFILDNKEYEVLDGKYEAGRLLLGDKAKMDSIMEGLDKIWCLEEMKAG